MSKDILDRIIRETNSPEMLALCGIIKQLVVVQDNLVETQGKLFNIRVNSGAHEGVTLLKLYERLP